MAATVSSISPRGLSAGFWALSAALLAIGAFLVADALARRPSQAPIASLDLTPAAEAAPPEQKASPEAYEALAGAPVFGPSSPVPATAPELADASMKVTVIACMVNGEHSRAILSMGAGVQKLVQVGDVLEGGRVARITRTEVILERDGREIALPVHSATHPPAAPGAASPAPAAAAPAAAAPLSIGLSPAEPAGQKYSPGGVDTGDIELKDFDAFYGDLKQGLLEAQTKPAHDAGGKPVGLDFAGVPESKLLWRMGLRPGDIATAVNNVPVTDMNTLLNAFDKVAADVRSGNETFIVIDLVRNQKPDTVILTIWTQ